jgi:hypothetical protein
MWKLRRRDPKKLTSEKQSPSVELSEESRAVLRLLSETSPGTISFLLARDGFEQRGVRWLHAQLKVLEDERLVEIKDGQISLTSAGILALMLINITDLRIASGGNIDEPAIPRRTSPVDPDLHPGGSPLADASPVEASLAHLKAESICNAPSRGHPRLAEKIIRMGQEPRREEVPDWLVENIPRQMRAHVPVDVEVRVSKYLMPQFVSGLIGQAKPILHETDVAPAMSLRLTCTKGSFQIDPHGAETQWVMRGENIDEFGSWKFTLIPRLAGKSTLFLTVSYKLVGPGGVVADSMLPEKTLEIAVQTNVWKTCNTAAAWGATLVAGAALGAYFDPLVKLLRQWL